MPIYNETHPPQPGYYLGEVCERGHPITEYADKYPESRQPFCAECGAVTITACGSCSSPIRGASTVGGVSLREWVPDRHCIACGKPYPWTAKRLAAAEQAVDLVEGLTDDERAKFKMSIADLGQDTPDTEVAVMRVKLLLSKAKGEGVGLLRASLTAVATEAAKQLLFAR